jgi:predicted bacteriocin transport accessory protein
MKSKKELIIGIVAIIVIILSFILSEQTNTKGNNVNNTAGKVGIVDITLDKYFELVNDTKSSIIYIGRPTCGYCQKFTPILKTLTEQYQFSINYLNTDSLDQSGWDKFIASDEYFKGSWGTPLILIVGNGKIIDKHENYVEKAAIESYFRSKGFIK